MGMSLGQELLTEADHIEDPVLRIIERFKKHPSVVAIFENHKEIADFFFFNHSNCMASSVFPSNFKNAEITPVHKKDPKNTECNYRPFSILSNISKTYEKCIFSQISSYFEKLLSRYQFDFRKGYSTQQCLLVMIEKWRQNLDKGGHYGVLLIDISKAFDCVSYDLMIAKLHGYGFDIPALKLLHHYLTNRKQRVKIDRTFSSWEEVLFAVPQGSILGPLLFNIFLCDLFLFINDINIASYADDNTLYTVDKNPEKIIKVLEHTSVDLLTWFKNNGMKANADKCHLLVNSKRKVCAKIGAKITRGSY